jgi:hypothetical protein
MATIQTAHFQEIEEMDVLRLLLAADVTYESVNGENSLKLTGLAMMAIFLDNMGDLASTLGTNIRWVFRRAIEMILWEVTGISDAIDGLG